MSQRMQPMSKLMHRMSGLDDRPAMKEPELKKQMDQMLKQVVHPVSSTLSRNSYRLPMYKLTPGIGRWLVNSPSQSSR